MTAMNTSGLGLINFSVIESKPILWLWKDRIPLGKLTIFSGNPGCGKTTVLLDIIARYTNGLDWPDGAPNDDCLGDVLLLNAEDDPADTLKPRLQGAHADLACIDLVESTLHTSEGKYDRQFGLDSDLDQLRELLQRNPKVGLLIIDPISSYLGDADMNKEQKVREVLTPLAKLAEDFEVTIIGNSHFNKRGDVSAQHRTMGAVAFSGVARQTWLFDRDREDKTLFHMMRGKGNLTGKRTGLKYRITEIKLPTGPAAIIDWQGDDDIDADEALAPLEKESKMDHALSFLEEYMTDPRPARDVETKAENRGISRRTLARAKERMGIRSRQLGKEWLWELPGKVSG